MPRSTHTRIDPWSRWANFTMDSWECWLDAYCKRSANDGAAESAELAPAQRSHHGAPAPINADARFAEGRR